MRSRLPPPVSAAVSIYPESGAHTPCAQMADNPAALRMTIGAAPTLDAVARSDLRLLKTALLYADKVELCSPGTSLLLWGHGMRSAFSEENRGAARGEQLALVVLLAISFLYSGTSREKEAAAARAVEHMSWLGELDPEIRALVEAFTHDLSLLHDSLEAALSDPALQPGLGEIVQAVETGLVEVHWFTAAEPEGVVREFTTVLSRAIAEGATHPLLDAGASELVARALGPVTGAGMSGPASRGKHVRLAARLFERLPTFDDLSVAEVLAVRRDLDSHLVRFRSSMIRFSEEITTAVWDRDFDRDAEHVILRDVEPALLELEEAIRENGLWGRLARKLVDHRTTLATGSLALVLSEWAALPSVVLRLLGVGLPAATLVYDTVSAWQEQRRDTGKHSLYFYSQLRRHPRLQ